ncbi:hypothetical protein HPG69_015134 [Diceros bicornis minor]|uniref:Uncharacterized protein n=1 Tax=Diceros bicornis minor TaxID=77932 RepID=A0A7J7FKU6_DICBM|nr:hypothetical protein HPG69_015134 [Diceros bicornis minor]
MLKLVEYWGRDDLAKRLANVNFLQDFALLIDIFEEFSLFSIALQSRSTNIQKKQSIFNYFDLLKPSPWPYEEQTLPRIAGGGKLYHLSDILKHEINLNDFQDFVDNNVKSNNCEMVVHVLNSRSRIKQ